MKADIYIPTANNIQALSECLESLRQQSYKKFRVIVVGIRHDDNVQNLLNNFKDLRIQYLIQSAPGLVQAAQEAYEHAEGDIFIRIDDDVVTTPDWLKHIVEIFQSHPEVGGVTGPTITSADGRKSRDLFLFFERTRSSKNPLWRLLHTIYTSYIYENRLYDVGHFMRSGAFTLGSNFENSLTLKTPIEVDNLEACNMAMRMSVLKQYHGFDLIFNRGLGEYHEADIAYKIKKAGYKVWFSSQVQLQHKVENTETASKPRADAFHRISNFIIFYKRHIGVKNADYLARFLTNILFQNGYYCYKCISTGDWRQLGALGGTVYGILKKT